MKGLMHNNWVDKHFILGMNGSWHNFYQNTVSDEQIQQQQSWQPPEVGWLKRNINVGFHDQGQVQLGIKVHIHTPLSKQKH
ncbi:hypothetical protein P8452_58241 [Trifolium repens]|nr:hypothetical protein P8452_58241 [Trifolium repens]